VLDETAIADEPRWGRSIGSPKQPTFTVCSLVDGEYELQQFREHDAIVSPSFPDLPLTVNQIFGSAS